MPIPTFLSKAITLQGFFIRYLLIDTNYIKNYLLVPSESTAPLGVYTMQGGVSCTSSTFSHFHDTF